MSPLIWLLIYRCWVDATPVQPDPATIHDTESHGHADNAVRHEHAAAMLQPECEIDFDIIIDAIQQSRLKRNTINVLVVYAPDDDGGDADVSASDVECWSIDAVVRRLHAFGKTVLLRRLELVDAVASESNNSVGDDVSPARHEEASAWTALPMTASEMNGTNGEEEADYSATYTDTMNETTGVHSGGNSLEFHEDCEQNCSDSVPMRIADSAPPPRKPTSLYSTDQPSPSLPNTFSIIFVLPRDTDYTHPAITPILAQNPSIVKIILLHATSATTESQNSDDANNNNIPSDGCTEPSSNNSKSHSNPVGTTTPEERQQFARLARQLWRAHRVRNLYYVSTVSAPRSKANRRNSMARQRCRNDAADDEQRTTCLTATGTGTIRQHAGAKNANGNAVRPMMTRGQTPAADVRIDISADILSHDPFDSSSWPQTTASDANASSTDADENAGSLLWHRRVDASDCRRVETGAMSSAPGVIVIRDFNEFLERANRIDFKRTQLNISFFPATMGYLKRTSGYYRKQFRWWAVGEVSDSGSHLCPSGGVDCTNAYYGADVETLNEVARRMNFTPYLMEAEDGLMYGYKTVDGRFTGAMGDVLSHRTEMIMNAFFLKYYDTTELQFTAGMYSDKLCFVVRSAELMPEQWLILDLFGPGVWLAIACTLLSSSIVHVELLNRFSGANRDDRVFGWLGGGTSMATSEVYQRLADHLDVHIRYIGMMLSKPEAKLCRSFSEYMLMVACLLWSLVLTGVFQGSLYTVYSHPTTYRNINTLEELTNSDLRIAIRDQGVLSDLASMRQSKQTLDFFTNRVTYFKPSSGVYDTLMENPGMADTDREINYRLVLMRYMGQNGISQFHMLNDCPMSYTLSYMVHKNANHQDKLNSLVLNFLAAGLYFKWFGATENIFYMENRAYQIEHSEARKMTVLGVTHLYIAFLLLGVGLVLSAGIFALEKWKI